MATFVVDVGLAIVTDALVGGALAAEPKFIGWGTGAGTAAATDTTLFTEALVSLAAGTSDHTTGTSSQVTTTTTNDTYQVTGTRAATGTGTVTNAGLWDTASAGILFLKGDFGGIALVSGDSIAFTFKGIFAN